MAQLSLGLANIMQTIVVIPTYNRLDLLKQALSSVWEQTLPVDRVIVVDDGSSDGTAAYLSRQQANLETLRQDNRGKSAALNAALAQIDHGWIWIVDDDDLLPPTAHQKLRSLTRAAPSPAFVYGRHDRFRASEGTDIHERLGTGYWSDCADDMFYWETLKDMFAHQGAMLVDRAAFRDVGAFDTSLKRSQDYEMLIRLARQFTPRSTQDIVLHQRLHDGQRGVASQRFEPSKSFENWMIADREIFRRLYDERPVSDYLIGLPRPYEIWMGHLRRAVVMARHDLWQEALNDFEAAADRATPSLKGTPLEIQVLRSARDAFSGKYGIGAIENSASIQRQITDLGHRSDLGKAIVRELARGLVWRAREAVKKRELRRFARLTQLVISWTKVSKSGRILSVPGAYK